jgi:hypothetical protein
MRVGEFELNDPVPELKDPHVLAVLRPWIDVGNVGTLSINRVERHLKSQELGRLATPGLFYDFTRYRPRSFINEGRREVTVPNTIVRYASREEGPDLITIHLLEPHLYGEDYTDSLLDLLNHFDVKRYSLIGGMYDMVPHTRPLMVTGVGDGPGIEEERLQLKTKPSDYEGPTTITYLVAQEAAKRGIDTRAFVVHLPQYLQVEEDFTGTARMMQILCSLYQLPERLIDVERGQDQYAKLQDTVDNPEVASLLKRLEDRYDQENREETEEAPPSPLSPNIEEFLKDLDQGFDTPR